jgi:hypothetical protein
MARLPVLKVSDGFTLSVNDILCNVDRTKPVNKRMKWNAQDGSTALILELTLKGWEKWLQIIHVDPDTGDEINSYPILIEAVSVGFGERYYFVCPISNRRCSLLHLVGTEPQFKHRTAFNKPLHYPSQYLNATQRKDYRWQFIEALLPTLKSRVVKTHYRNNATPLIKRIQKLEYRAFELKYRELLREGYKPPSHYQVKKIANCVS